MNRVFVYPGARAAGIKMPVVCLIRNIELELSLVAELGDISEMRQQPPFPHDERPENILCAGSCIEIASETRNRIDLRRITALLDGCNAGIHDAGNFLNSKKNLKIFKVSEMLDTSLIVDDVPMNHGHVIYGFGDSLGDLLAYSNLSQTQLLNSKVTNETKDILLVALDNGSQGENDAVAICANIFDAISESNSQAEISFLTILHCCN